MKLTSHFKHGHLADRRGKKGGVDDIIGHNYRPGLGFSGDASGKEPPCQFRRHKRCGFSPWVGKILWKEGLATHCRILAWRIPWTEEPGELLSMGSQRV